MFSLSRSRICAVSLLSEDFVISSIEMICILLQEDLSMHLLSEWIDFRSLGILDMAIRNHKMRMIWLQRLCTISNIDINDWKHSHSSLRWLIMRGLKASSVVMNSEDRNTINDSTFEGFEMAGLQHLSLDCRMRVTDAGVLLMVNGCPLLQSIDLSGCSSITDVSVAAVDHGCPLLQSIYICMNITDNGVSALGHGCPLLQSINFSFCGGITDAGVAAVVNGCPLLQSINLCHCNSITGAGVSAIGQGCPLLQSINLYYCERVTDTGVSALARGCPLLQSVNLRYCPNITDASILLVAHECPLLQEIDIYDCNVAEDFESRLSREFPQLRFGIRF